MGLVVFDPIVPLPAVEKIEKLRRRLRAASGAAIHSASRTGVNLGLNLSEEVADRLSN